LDSPVLSRATLSILLATYLPCYADSVPKERAAHIYDAYCFVCHGTGWQGAPIAATSDWDPRKAKGIETLLKSALEGLNGMPPKGTCTECSTDDLRAAIELMMEEQK
jgi:cytochrome c5